MFLYGCFLEGWEPLEWQKNPERTCFPLGIYPPSSSGIKAPLSLDKSYDLNENPADFLKLTLFYHPQSPGKVERTRGVTKTITATNSGNEQENPSAATCCLIPGNPERSGQIQSTAPNCLCLWELLSKLP